MVFLLYDLLLLCAGLLIAPWYWLRGRRRGKVRRGLRERLGWYAKDRLKPLKGATVIWVHAVSVGETRAAIPLLRQLKARWPEARLVLTNTTETGQAISRSLPEADLCLYFPYDFSPVVRRVLRLLRPALVIVVDTEIWPNLARLCGRNRIPLVLVNGRISDRSFPRYRLVRWLLKPVLAPFSAFCMQSAQDAARIRALGAPQQRVQVTGNIKFDLPALRPAAEEVRALKQRFGIDAESLVWVAGSTHAGEEELVAECQRQLAAERPLVLVLVPRHPERCRLVGEMLSARGMAWTLRSRFQEGQGRLNPGEVLLVDSVGEMLSFYALADVVFVGGSLVPTGGHNILEAAMLSRAVLHGPHMYNFREIAQLVRQAGGSEEVADSTDLRHVLARLLDDPDRRAAMGEAGLGLIRGNSGATDRVMEVITPLLRGKVAQRP